MANYVINDLTAYGSVEQLASFKKAVSCEGSGFDFNQILPMPKSLNIVAGSCMEPAMLAYAMYVHDKETTEIIGRFLTSQFCYTRESLSRDLAKAKTLFAAWTGRPFDVEDVKYDSDTSPADLFTEYAKYGKVYFENLRQYGCPTWYEWSYIAWGTKWNAGKPVVGEIVAVEDGSASLHIRFDTAWAMPSGIFQAMTKKFPCIGFEGSWADEDIGRNAGTWSAKGGVLQTIELEDEAAIRLGCELWGHDFDEYMREQQ